MRKTFHEEVEVLAERSTCNGWINDILMLGMNTNARTIKFAESYFWEKARNVWKHGWRRWRPCPGMNQVSGR